MTRIRHRASPEQTTGMGAGWPGGMRLWYADAKNSRGAGPGERERRLAQRPEHNERWQKPPSPTTMLRQQRTVV